jgi:hypothetical protein
LIFNEDPYGQGDYLGIEPDYGGPKMVVTRLLSVDDAEELTALVGENREFLAPWEPQHDELYFTVEGQRDSLRRALEAYAREAMVPIPALRHRAGLPEDRRPLAGPHNVPPVQPG